MLQMHPGLNEGPRFIGPAVLNPLTHALDEVRVFPFGVKEAGDAAHVEWMGSNGEW